MALEEPVEGSGDERKGEPPLRLVKPGIDASPSPGRIMRGEFSLLAVLSVIVGTFLLLDNFGILTGIYRLWPVFPASVGVGFFIIFYQRRRHDLVLMGIGSFLVGVSVLFFVCNYTSWRILTRAWPAFIALVGISSVLASFYAHRARRAMWVSGGSLMMLGIVFFLVFGVHPGLWPASLIAFGAWILVLTRARRRAP